MPANLASKTTTAQDRREGRYAARHTLWTLSDLRRVKNCGRAPQRNGVGVLIKVTEDAAGRHAGVGNVQHCGSVWACPVDSATINARRQSDIERALSAWYRGSCGQTFGKVALVTFTMRHNKTQGLAGLWDALGDSWHLVASGDGWTVDQSELGVMVPGTVYKSGKRKGQKRADKIRIPIIRVVEVTYGVNGWHVHIHALLLLPSSATDESVAALGSRMYSRWVGGLRARGLDATEFRGVDARLLKGDPSLALGEYFTKATYSASHEVTGSGRKGSRMGGRTPFGILADIVDQERSIDAAREDLALWHEYERASKGRRQIEWSNGLRALLLPVEELVEVTDQELVDAAAGGDEVAEIDGAVWRLITSRRFDYKLLRAFERSNRNGWRLLWLYSDAAGSDSAAHWAEMLTHPDPVRRRIQTKDRL